jgi:hypothetical protein
MKSEWMLAAVLALPAAVMAQGAVPEGTILPVSLNKGLNVRTAHPGQEIRAKVMEDVPGTTIRRRADVIGHVVEVNSSGNGPARLALRFDTVVSHGQSVPIRTNLRALASFVEIEGAQVPEEMASRGLNPQTWTTEQIGGDQVYRGGGPVAVGITTVGEPTPYGVLGVPRVQTGQKCRGVVADANQPQAMWLFSTDACGVYGYANIRIEHAGRTDPAGIIVLVSENGKLRLQSGSGMLLRVQKSADSART